MSDRPSRDFDLSRDPEDMADAVLASWLTPGELQMRHERGDHEHCPPTWCEVAAIYKQADDQCRRPHESSVTPSGSDQGGPDA